MVVDEKYLYFVTSSLNGGGDYYLQRCDKSDCWRTLTPLISMNGLVTELRSGLLGWMDDRGLQRCHTPDCKDVQVLEGAVVPLGSLLPPVWDDQYICWFLPRDNSIYRCELPNCDRGPLLVAPTTAPLWLKLADGRLYWFSNDQGMLRTSAAGTLPIERFTMDQQMTWVASAPEVLPSLQVGRAGMQLDGPWVYAALSAGVGAIVCEGCSSSIRLARWRYAENGAEREWLLVDDASFNASFYMRVFDGEVVWVTSNRDLWSCLADDCAATKRQLGVDVHPYDSLIAADDRFIYWLSAKCTNDGSCGDVSNLKRTPRIPK